MPRTTPALKNQSTPPWSPFNRVWNTISYLMLGICLTISLLDAALQPLQKGLIVLLAAAWGSWYWVFVMQRPRLRINTLGMMLAFLGAIAISTALSWIHSAFVMLLFSFYGLTFAMLPMALGCFPGNRHLVYPGLAVHRLQRGVQYGQPIDPGQFFAFGLFRRAARAVYQQHYPPNR